MVYQKCALVLCTVKVPYWVQGINPIQLYTVQGHDNNFDETQWSVMIFDLDSWTGSSFTSLEGDHSTLCMLFIPPKELHIAAYLTTYMQCIIVDIWHV